MEHFLYLSQLALKFKHLRGIRAKLYIRSLGRRATTALLLREGGSLGRILEQLLVLSLGLTYLDLPLRDVVTQLLDPGIIQASGAVETSYLVRAELNVELVDLALELPVPRLLLFLLPLYLIDAALEAR